MMSGVRSLLYTGIICFAFPQNTTPRLQPRSVQPILVHLLEARPLPHRIPERREPVLALLRLGVRDGQASTTTRLCDGKVLHEREPVTDVRLELRDRARAVVREGPTREADEPREPRSEVQVREGQLVAWGVRAGDKSTILSIDGVSAHLVHTAR